MTQCEFHPFIDNQIVSCGKNQITFWTYDGNSLHKKAGIFEVFNKFLARQHESTGSCCCHVDVGVGITSASLFKVLH